MRTNSFFQTKENNAKILIQNMVTNRPYRFRHHVGQLTLSAIQRRHFCFKRLRIRSIRTHVLKNQYFVFFRVSKNEVVRRSGHMYKKNSTDRSGSISAIQRHYFAYGPILDDKTRIARPEKNIFVLLSVSCNARRYCTIFWVIILYLG